MGKVQSGNSTAATVEALARIWERVLGRSPIGAEETFGDLGGNDGLVDGLFAEIAQTFHRELPSATICYAPTISALARLLELPTLPHFSPFVPLKEGRTKPPVLIVHGVGGRASFGVLAKHIRTENPIYGVQAKGVDGMEKPFGRIEDMAEYYLDALRGLESNGPYILIGYSFGGLIALEMAQRLSERGKQIALLAMLDTYPHPRHLSPTQRLWLGLKRIDHHLSDLRRKPLEAATGELVGMLKRRLPNQGEDGMHASPASKSPLSFAENHSSCETERLHRHEALSARVSIPARSILCVRT